MSDTEPRMTIAEGDITKLDVDAIVNAANSRLLPGSGVCGAIHRAAGPQLADACEKIYRCPTGEARLTPRQLAAIARYGWEREALPALLPGGGWSGTLSRRFTGADEALRVWAKTGTLNYGSALAGYLFPTTGRPAIFVTMVSDTGARDAYDALLPYPGPAAQRAAQSWRARARALQDALVESWLQPIPTS